MLLLNSAAAGIALKLIDNFFFNTRFNKPSCSPDGHVTCH